MIEELKMWIPYNLFIGDLKINNTTPVEIIEEWRDVKGYEGYYKVSSFGRVQTVDRKTAGGVNVKSRFVNSKNNAWGYLSVALNAPVETTKQVHILVAQAFLDNPFNKPLVNHKNGNKKDPLLYNLEWSTHSENTKHSYAIGTQVAIRHDSQCLILLDTFTGVFYDSIGELSLLLGIPKATISSRIRRKQITSRYIFA